MILVGSHLYLLEAMINQGVRLIFMGRHSIVVGGTFGDRPNIGVVAFNTESFVPVFFSWENMPDMKIADALRIAGRNRSFHLCDVTSFMSMRDVALMTGCSFILSTVRNGFCNFGVMRDIEMISSLQTHDSLCQLHIPILRYRSEPDIITMTSALIAFTIKHVESLTHHRTLRRLCV
jgi:hypothetical protein